MTQLDDTEFERTILIGMNTAREPAPAPDALGHYLVLVEGAQPGKRVEIGTTPVTIGRDTQQTLVFSDPELSRRHARVLLVNDEPVVEDLGSTNGIVVDGQHTTRATLRDGSRIVVGSSTIIYRQAEG